MGSGEPVERSRFGESPKTDNDSSRPVGQPTHRIQLARLSPAGTNLTPRVEKQAPSPATAWGDGSFEKNTRDPCPTSPSPPFGPVTWQSADRRQRPWTRASAQWSQATDHRATELARAKEAFNQQRYALALHAFESWIDEQTTSNRMILSTRATMRP